MVALYRYIIHILRIHAVNVLLCAQVFPGAANACTCFKMQTLNKIFLNRDTLFGLESTGYMIVFYRTLRMWRYSRVTGNLLVTPNSSATPIVRIGKVR